MSRQVFSREGSAQPAIRCHASERDGFSGIVAAARTRNPAFADAGRVDVKTDGVGKAAVEPPTSHCEPFDRGQCAGSTTPLNGHLAVAADRRSNHAQQEIFMKSLILSLAASVALFAAPALAHDPKSAVDAASAKPMAEMTDTELHAHCKALMGHKMDGRVPHDHSVEKLGHAPPPAKPLSAAEMQAQHDKCTAIMAEASAGLKTK
jgi:hypothetical protein